MTVDKLGDNKLLIKLDESDMENFELDFGKMSFKNEDNQKVIIGLMRLAPHTGPDCRVVRRDKAACQRPRQ